MRGSSGSLADDHELSGDTSPKHQGRFHFNQYNFLDLPLWRLVFANRLKVTSLQMPMRVRRSTTTCISTPGLSETVLIHAWESIM